MNKRIFVFHDGKTYPVLETWALRLTPSAIAQVIVKLGHYLRYRRNQRSREYMERFAKEIFPDFHPDQMVMAERKSQLPILPRSPISELVLLWPDANGTGWTNIERQIFRRKPAGCTVVVLNGRRRHFELTRGQWRLFQWRRFAEKSFGLEMGVLIAFLITSPWLALWDYSRGRLDR